MGPLENPKEDLLSKLAGYSSSGSSSSVVAPSSGAKSSALAAAIVSILGNVGSTILSNRLTQQRAEWQNQQNIAQWHRENAYNNPSAQMARLAAAGINPSLAYANGDLMNEAASSPQLTSGEVFSPVQFDPLTAAQIANLDSQSQKNLSEIPVNEQRAEEIRQSARKLQIEGNFAAATYAARVADMLATSNLSAKKATEELKYAAANVKADSDRIQAIADKAINEKLISQEQYNQAKELTRKLAAEADIAQYDKSKAQFWHEVYSRAVQLVQTTEQVVSFLHMLYEKGHEHLNENIDYFFPD